MDTIVSATTAHEQQHGTHTKFDQGSTFGEVKVVLVRLVIKPNVVGKRIKLIRTDDPYLNPRDRGTVVDVSELPYEGMPFKVLVQWDNGSRLPILEGRDDYRVVYDDEDD